MSEIKISNKLLEFVYGCKCEFGIIENNTVYYYYTDEKGLAQLNFENLDTFVRLAENKAFSENYLVSPIIDGFIIFNILTGDPILEIGGKIHILGTTKQKLVALEWIAKQIQES